MSLKDGEPLSPKELEALEKKVKDILELKKDSKIFFCYREGKEDHRVAGFPREVSQEHFTIDEAHLKGARRKIPKNKIYHFREL